MVEEAPLEEVDSGLTPVADGWFVVNVREAAWLTNKAFGARCVFESDRPVLRRRPDLPVHKFADVGFTLQVVQPGQPSGMYHAESNQENFLVLAGECTLLVEGEERSLRAWISLALPAGYRARLRWRWERALRHLHDGRTDQGEEDRLSALGPGYSVRRGCRDRDELGR
jgi:mannose-6-phosphate isomerase-like protein (cupin superfamily)